MNCCEKCFNDLEIKDIIRSKDKIGHCDICGSDDVYIYNIESNNELTDMFNNLLNEYDLSDDLNDYPDEQLSLLKDELKNNWNIFNLTPDKIGIIVKNICYDKYEENPNFFRSSIGFNKLTDKQYLEDNLIIKCNTWNNFKSDIKSNTRFHSKTFNDEAFGYFLKYINKKYINGTTFYRARISGRKGFHKDEMFAPPLGTAIGGRANPTGISYLYLASDYTTAVSEIRASALDYITIGEFKLLEDIEVIDFEAIDKISPFFGGIEISKLRTNYHTLRRISSEISMPLGGKERILSYLPTQYIVDYIKSIGEWQGIKYKSTLGDGENLAVFNEKLFKCVGVQVKQVNKLNYTFI